MYLRTCHGTFVVTDDNGRLCHVMQAGSPGEVFVEVSPELGESPTESSIRSGVMIRSGVLKGFIVYWSKTSDGLNLCRDGYFLCAEPRSRELVCNRLTPGPWELFSLTDGNGARPPLPHWKGRRYRNFEIAGAAQICSVQENRIASTHFSPTGRAEIQIFCLADACVLGAPGIFGLESPGGALSIISESVPYPDRIGPFASTRIAALETPTDGPAELIEKACLLDSLNATNFWHWYTEYVPRAIALELMGFDGVYLVPSVNSAFAESLRCLGIPEARIRLNRNVVSRVRSLYFTENFNGHDLARWPWLLEEIRRRAGSGHIAALAPRRIYIGRRGDKRRVSNESEVLSKVMHYGFVPVYLEDIPICEQIAVTRNAEVIIGPHGAGLVYAMFMPRGGVLIELFHARYINPCLIRICELLDIDYRMLVSQVNPANNFRPDDLIEVQIENLMHSLKSTLKNDPCHGSDVEGHLYAQSPQVSVKNGRKDKQSMGFLELMVKWLDQRYPLANKVIYEVGADPHMVSASAMIERGAKLVLATNLGSGWHYEPPSKAVALTLDVHDAASVIGADSIDLVYGVNILEHVCDLPRALEAIKAVLKPGGIFFLHGHPFWTSATGHHALYEQYSFGGPKDPLPSWSHLYMDADEMRACLKDQGVPAAGIDHIVTFALESTELNRTPLRLIEAAFSASGLEIVGADKTRTDPPDKPILERIMASQWWSESEDFSVRQGSYWGRKP